MKKWVCALLCLFLLAQAIPFTLAEELDIEEAMIEESAEGQLPEATNAEAEELIIEADEPVEDIPEEATDLFEGEVFSSEADGDAPGDVEYASAEAERTNNGAEDFEIEDGVLVEYTGEDETVIIPAGVKVIGDKAFEDCYDLTDVVIPNGVITIGEYAFSWCFNLTNVIIPNSVTSIGQCAFQGCERLTSITIPNGVISIEDLTFDSCTGLTRVTIPNSVTSIGSYAFYECTGLTSVTIPNSVTSIGDEAFKRCRSLTSITIPNSVTSIGYGAFYECTSLTSIIISNKVTKLEFLSSENAPA